MKVTAFALLLLVPCLALASDAPPTPRDLYAAGAEAFKCGDINASLRAFDQLIERAPEERPHLWQRGISLYYAERWETCVDQFEIHRTVNSDDVENSVWHYLCLNAKDGSEAARKHLLPAQDSRIPMMAVFALFAGTADVDAVFKAVEKVGSDPRRRRIALFYANLYVGLWYESRGEVEQATVHLRRSLKGPPINHYMQDVARIHLKRLDGEAVCQCQGKPEAGWCSG